MGHGLDVLFKVVVSWTLLDQVCQNVLFFRSREGDPSDTVEEDVNVIVPDVFNNFATPLRDNMSNECHIANITCTSLNQPPDRFAIETFEGFIGAIDSPSLPSYVAGVISYHTGYSGRRTHGRTYVCGIPRASQNGNDLTGGAQTVLQNTADHIKNRYGRDGSFSRAMMCSFSKANGQSRSIIPPPPHLVYDVLASIPIRQADARTRLFTQRHRLAGRGV